MSQQEELDARDMMLKEIFYKSDTVLETILAHQSQGVGLVQKILTCSAIPSDEKIGIADRVRLAMQRMPEFKEGSSVNKKLLEELKNIPKGDCFATASSLQQDEDNVSPLTSQVGFFQDSLPVLANTGGGYSLKRR